MNEEDVVRRVMSVHSIPFLNPVQEDAITKGLFKQENMVISAPTGSGKTLCAEMAALHTMLSGKKTVIISPLKALASEHYETFKKLHPNTALSIGDYDSQDAYLKRYDIISCSYEKFDSLLRHRSPWIRDIGLLVVDEVHELDSDRGPALEAVITRFLHSFPGARVLALSATIPNAFELADWLDARLVMSDYRAVPLKEGVYHDSVIDYGEDQERVTEEKEDAVSSLVSHALKKGHQCLVFANTRRNAESLAKRLSKLTSKHAPPSSLPEKILGALESPTEQCKRLADLTGRGCAFHHAGLVQKQRRVVEDAFRKGELRVLVATPTVAAGVNLPAHYVIIPSVHVYRGGPTLMSVREYKQKVGRAGRIKYDQLGEAITIARSDAEKNLIIEKYVNGVPERVDSRMGDPAVMRSHVLACTCSMITRPEEVTEYFSKTFYAYLSGKESLQSIVFRVLDELEGYGFLKKSGERYIPTKLGLRVNELYIDPLSAKSMLDCILSGKRATDVGYLLMIADTSEMSPWLSVSKKDELRLFELAAKESEGLFKPVDGLHFDYFYLNKFKLAMMLNDWVNEKTEQAIMNDYNIPPGVLYSFLSNADWLLYSASELARISGKRDTVKELFMLRHRVKHGVRKELMPLVMLKHVGRVRARIMWNAGIRKPADLKEFPVPELERLLGKKTAGKVLEQVTH